MRNKECKMKNIYKICTTIAISFLVLGCSGGGSSTNATGQKIQGTDKYTGLSRAAVEAQLAVGINSPYQLIKRTEYMVDPVLKGNFTPKEIESVLSDQLKEVMPKASNSVREEINSYLVDYYMKNTN
jgi:hypothetical protein